MIGQIWSRLQLLIAKGALSLVYGDKIQAKILDGEVLDNVERVEPYGLSYHPKAGSQVYLAFPSGDRSFGMALLIGDKRYQMALKEGEVGLHDDAGNYVALLQGGVAHVKASAQVIADAPLFSTTGDAQIGGNLNVLGMLTQQGISCGVDHNHISSTPGTPTSGVNHA